MKYRELWKLCEEVIETYDMLPKTAVTTHDDHIEEILGDRMDLEHADLMFVREAAGGLFRSRKMAELALVAYCEGMSRNRHQDYVAMQLIAYLLVYRYEEIGGDAFRRLIYKSTTNNKIAEFIQFLLDPDQLEKHAIPRWTTVFDDEYTESVIVGNLMSNKDSIEAHVLEWYLQKATSQESATTKGLKTLGDTTEATISLAPRIKASSPKFTKKDKSASKRADLSTLPPVEVREMVHTKPLPKPPKIADTCTEWEREAVNAAKNGEHRSTLDPTVKLQNRRREQEIPFHEFKAQERPLQRDRLLEEKAEREAKEVEQLWVNRPTREQVRRHLEEITTTVDVRTTNAALRREELIYKKRQAEEDAELLRKERDLRDDSEYWAWRRKEEAKDKVTQDALIKQRKIDQMIADEDARAVRIKQEKANQAISRQFRAENAKFLDSFNKKEEKRIAVQKEKALQLKADLKQDTQEALQRVAVDKKGVVKQMKTEKHENEMKVAVAFELERQRKQELIKEIKILHERLAKLKETERERKKHVNPVDLGQLVTMSTEELKQKLVEVKSEQREWTERKRQEIVAAREREKQEQSAITQRIMAERSKFRDQKDRHRAEQRAAAAVEAEKLRVEEEKKIFELQKKLQEKRESRKAEVDRRREDERQRRLAAQLLSADAGAIEAEKWREMQRGAENTIVAAQNARLRANRVERAKLQRIETTRDRNIEDAFESKKATHRATDDLLSTKRQTYFDNREHDDRVRREAMSLMQKEKEIMRTHTA